MPHPSTARSTFDPFDQRDYLRPMGSRVVMHFCFSPRVGPIGFLLRAFNEDLWSHPSVLSFST